MHRSLHWYKAWICEFRQSIRLVEIVSLHVLPHGNADWAKPFRAPHAGKRNTAWNHNDCLHLEISFSSS